MQTETPYIHLPSGRLFNIESFKSFKSLEVKDNKIIVEYGDSYFHRQIMIYDDEIILEKDLNYIKMLTNQKT